ncbi:unnamed protein product [Cylindrotheca closterium]|uniref:MYND-type domain-containing protein n=1 Tax=Cylindrotheca closterium TaxID=2856 RepID=A0AAD2PVX3_9STRA|nr:unnamed protein product [Cylindrotheca closterium]
MSSTPSKQDASIDDQIDNPLAKSPNIVDWVQSLDLGYDEPTRSAAICFYCGKSSPSSRCGKCGIAFYCNRECQTIDWKNGRHKHACASYIRLSSLLGGNDRESTQTTVRNEIFGRIRFYACPYAVFKTQELGKGFLFIQSNCTLAELSLTIPKDTTGRVVERSILMHFLTLGEFDADVISDDFEMAVTRTKLQELVNMYNPEKEVVLLLRLRCGHVSLGNGVLVPDYQICKNLGVDYYAESTAEAVQLNLDDL